MPGDSESSRLITGKELPACSVGDQLTKEEIGDEAIAHLAKHYQADFGERPAGFDGLVERLKLVASTRNHAQWVSAWVKRLEDGQEEERDPTSKRGAEEGGAGDGSESKRVKDA